MNSIHSRAMLIIGLALVAMILCVIAGCGSLQSELRRYRQQNAISTVFFSRGDSLCVSSQIVDTTNHTVIVLLDDCYPVPEPFLKRSSIPPK